MATTVQKKRTFKYLNKDFNSFKRDFIEHLRTYFPDTVADFNESSVALIFTELAAFIGDNLSFYIDKSFNESFIETAIQPKNIFKHAKHLGFKAFGKSAATGAIDAFIKVPAIKQNQKIQPDARYAGIVKKGAKLKSRNGQTYETLVDIDFSTVDINDSQNVQIADRDPATKEPLTFVLRKTGIDIKAGETKITTFSIGNYKAFKKITLSDDDVLEVIKVTDSENNQWYEVDFLAQDTVFDSVVNTSADIVNVPYVLKLRSVPYRFITDYNVSTKKMSLIFGSGDAQSFDGDLIPDLGDLSLPVFGKDTFTDFSLDPQNFLKTRTLGLAPANTTLTVKYRVGGGLNTNAGANEIDTVADSIFTVDDSSLSSGIIQDVGNSFSVTNPNSIQGGRDELDIEEIRQLIPAIYASQSRVVTDQDFVARSLSMPSRFGSLFRVNAKTNSLNKNAVELVVLSKDSNGYVSTAPNDLKTNLKTYLSRFRMMTDGIEILDGEVINIGANLTVLTNPDFNKTEIAANCISVLQDFFNTDKFSLNQPINLTDIYVLLADVPGVLSVVDISISNKIGTIDGRTYSATSYNIKENTQNGIIYCKVNAMFEVKYPNKDIVIVCK